MLNKKLRISHFLVHVWIMENVTETLQNRGMMRCFTGGGGIPGDMDWCVIALSVWALGKYGTHYSIF